MRLDVSVHQPVKAIARGALHFMLDRLPEGTRVPILSGPLRGHWWHWTRPHYHYGTDRNHCLGDWGYVAGTYEPITQRLFVEHVQPGTWVFDIGAHHGFFSMLAGRLGALVVHAIEGDGQSLPWLLANTKWLARQHRFTCYGQYANESTPWSKVCVPDLVKMDIDGDEVSITKSRTNRVFGQARGIAVAI
jgi:hypothetical protein